MPEAEKCLIYAYVGSMEVERDNCKETFNILYIIYNTITFRYFIAFTNETICFLSIFSPQYLVALYHTCQLPIQLTETRSPILFF